MYLAHKQRRNQIELPSTVHPPAHGVAAELPKISHVSQNYRDGRILSYEHCPLTCSYVLSFLQCVLLRTSVMCAVHCGA